MVTKKLKGLGRGLEALLGPTAQVSAAAALGESGASGPALWVVSGQKPEERPRHP